MKESSKCICELCLREVGETTLHHLIPRSESKRHKMKIKDLPTAQLCLQCHKHIHAIFSNRKLGDELSTIKLLQTEESMQKYLKWVRKIPGEQVFKSKR